MRASQGKDSILKCKLTGIAASFALLLGAAEIGSRQFGFGNPLLYRPASSGYEIAPKQHIVRLGRTTTINALGTRGSELKVRPDRETWRVLVLGDSVANGGALLDDEQTFPAVTSARLTQAGCRNEVVNASAGGWSLFDEAAWIHQHGLYGANLVVWTINFMDLDQPPSTSAILDNNPGFPSHRPVSGVGEIVFRYILPRIGLAPSAADNGSVMAGDFDSRQFAAVQKLVRQVDMDLARRGTRLIVLYHDGRAPMPPAREMAERQFLLDLAALDIPVIKTGLSALPDRNGYYIDGIHPNAMGDQIIGQTLANRILSFCPHN